MKVKVTEKKVMITEISEVYEGEFGINRCDFSLPESFEGLSVTAIFNGIPVPLTDGKCIIPSLKNGNCILGVYAYRKNGEETELMYSPKPTMFFVGKGSFCREIDEEIIPEVFDYETYCRMLQGYWRELFGANTLTEYKEKATEHQFYSAKAVNEICQKMTELVPDEEYIARKIAEFREKEVEYTKIYHYDAIDLKNRISPISNKSLYGIDFEKVAKDDCFEAVVAFRLCVAYKDGNGNLKYYVDTPLKVNLSDEGRFVFGNNSGLWDMGLMVDGQPYPLRTYMKTLTDDGSFQNGNIWFGQSIVNDKEVTLVGRFKVSNKSEQVIDRLLEEIEGLLAVYDQAFLLYIKNLPEMEVVQAQYKGDN